MSENNVVELSSTRHVHASVLEDRGESAVEQSDLSDASDKPAPDVKDHELDEEILDALGSARKGLTEDGIAAVIALRREISIDTALEQLLLEGAIDACMADKNGALIVSNFRFFALKSEDTSADQIPADNVGTILE
jgi:hypothetical protein